MTSIKILMLINFSSHLPLPLLPRLKLSWNFSSFSTTLYISIFHNPPPCAYILRPPPFLYLILPLSSSSLRLPHYSFPPPPPSPPLTPSHPLPHLLEEDLCLIEDILQLNEIEQVAFKCLLVCVDLLHLCLQNLKLGLQNVRGRDVSV